MKKIKEVDFPFYCCNDDYKALKGNESLGCADTLCEFDSYDLEYINQAHTNTPFLFGCYIYGSGSYCGSGYIILLSKRKWYLIDCGHCSCYGPTEDLSGGMKEDKWSWKSYTEMKRKITAAYFDEIEVLFKCIDVITNAN